MLRQPDAIELLTPYPAIPADCTRPLSGALEPKRNVKSKNFRHKLLTHRKNGQRNQKCIPTIISYAVLTSSSVVTDDTRFTAHVGWSNVFGFSTVVVAPGTAEDTAPLSINVIHSATAKGAGCI